jgi:glycosyltransferase involved in cell wall biosynthesis
MKKKVLLFTTGGCGGSERVTLNMSRILDNHSYLVKNIILELDDKTELLPFIPTEIPYERIKIKRLRSSFFTILKIINNEKPNFVFSSISLIGVMLVIISFFNKNLKVIIRQGFMPKAGLDGSPLLIKTFYKKSYRIISQTEQMKESMIEYYGMKNDLIKVIHNPIDEVYINKHKDAISPFENQDEIKYVAVGRLGSFKDYETLIKAFEIVNSNNQNANLYILGSDYDKDYTAFIKNLVIEKGLSKYIHFEGFTDNPYRYLFNADCFVLSSTSEGLPNVMLEAMYLKIPVVATNCIPFIKETIVDGINGYCVKVKDYENFAIAMSNAIKLKGKISGNFAVSKVESILSVFN